MMDKNKIPEEIIDLLISKTYEELSASEKEKLTPHMNPEVYNDLKKIVADFKMADSQIEDQIPLTSFAVKKRSFITRIIHYPIPVYQVAAVFIFCFGLYFITENNCQKKDALPDHTIEVIEKGITIDQDSYPEMLIFNL